jgi:MoxR-like ATPase
MNQASENTGMTSQQRLLGASEIVGRLKQFIRVHPDTFPAIYDDRNPPQGYQGVFHFVDKNQPEPRTIHTIKTHCTKEEFEAVRAIIMPFRKTLQCFDFLLGCYARNEMAFVEGGTSIGKTFAVEKLTELIYGPTIKPVDFYCHGQTDASALLGKYIPNADTAAETKVAKFLIGAEGTAWLSEKRADGSLSHNTPHETLIALAAAHLNVTTSNKNFIFELGAVLKAATANNGAGTILHIEEVGLAKSAVINVLLQLGGKYGQISNQLQVWDDSGRVIVAGSEFRVIFSTNPLTYNDRHAVDDALARRGTWSRFGELEEADVKEAAEIFFAYRAGNIPEVLPQNCILDLSKQTEICKEIAEIISHFHLHLHEKLKQAQAGGDRQKIPLTYDDMTKLATYMLSSQVVNGGKLDLVETLKKGYRTIYLGRFIDSSSARIQEEELFATYLTNQSGVGVKAWSFKGTNGNFTPAQRLMILTEDAMSIWVKEEPACMNEIRQDFEVVEILKLLYKNLHTEQKQADLANVAKVVRFHSNFILKLQEIRDWQNPSGLNDEQKEIFKKNMQEFLNELQSPIPTV